jgi:hypothetical protein
MVILKNEEDMFYDNLLTAEDIEVDEGTEMLTDFVNANDP